MQKRIAEAIAIYMKIPLLPEKKLDLGELKLLTPLALTGTTINVGKEVGRREGWPLGCDDGRVEG